MVHKDTHQLVTNCLMDERCCHSRIHSTGETTNNSSAADLRGNGINLSGNDIAAVPVIRESCNLVKEVLEHCLAML